LGWQRQRRRRARHLADRRGGGRAIALLIGSEPRRAPRGIKEWGHIREEATEESSDVFGILSIADAESLDEAEARLAHGTGPALFFAMCSTVTANDDLALTLSVRVPANVTYRDFDRLLDGVSASTHWIQHRATRPVGAKVGFLAALESLIGTSVESAQDRVEPKRQALTTPFVYKGAVFDLRLAHTERVPQLRIGAEIFRDLMWSANILSSRTSTAVL
jgi:hypothetical protein